MKYFLTVKIAEVGTPYGGSGKSNAGHAWFELSQLDEKGNPVLFQNEHNQWRPFISSGFASAQGGSPSGEGRVFDTDTDKFPFLVS